MDDVVNREVVARGRIKSVFRASWRSGVVAWKSLDISGVVAWKSLDISGEGEKENLLASPRHSKLAEGDVTKDWLDGGRAGLRGKRERTSVALLVVHRPSILHGGVGFRVATLDALGSHPNIVRVLAIASDWQGDQCLLTEWAPLGPLDAVLASMLDPAAGILALTSPIMAQGALQNILTANGAVEPLISDAPLIRAAEQICAGLQPLISDAPLIRATEQICAGLQMTLSSVPNTRF
ncbi:hypothetical protein T484DRAFT_1818625 [Baffinella frigidus]|nr:hypothetical protein T484DRAFT_1818625 [Cryptophyta sp. CCMP2293]